jgi:glycosyltransferase involved in cell wall biosynthesis
LAEAARNPLLRWWLNQEAGRLARFEARTCREFDRVVTVTPEDGQALAGLYADGWPPPSFAVIPICVDPGPAPATGPGPDEPGILFLGGMHWPPNRDGVLWFAREVLPRVRAGLPRAQFFAVGRQPPGELRAVEAAVSVPGYVAAPHAYWARSQVFVVPLRAGGGMRVKILDAWARGLPVVSTAIGAEGLSCRHGEDILIADSSEEFASAVLRVLTERGLRERLSRGGRSTVERRYDWRLVYPAWDEIYAPLETESAGLGAARNS